MKDKNMGGFFKKLNEGGLHGHMAHMHENPNLTFKQIKDVFEKAASGELEGTEKTDGQNLYVSYSIKDGKAKAVRNKTQIRAGGLDAAALANQYKDHPNPNVRNAFVDTFNTFEQVVKSLSIEQQMKYFGDDADIFYNAEVMDPRSANVIMYDIPTLLIHRVGHVKADKTSGEIISVNITDFAEDLEAALENAQQGEKNRDFKVQLNALRTLQKLDDDKIAKDSIGALEKEINRHGVSDNQTIGEYIATKLLSGRFSDLGIAVPNMQDLIKRILGMREKVKDKKGKDVLRSVPVKRITKGVSPEIATQLKKFVKNSDKIFMEEVAPIETIIHDFAVEILKTMESAFIFDNSKEVQRLKKEVQKAINIIEASEDEHREDRIEILQKQLNKLKKAENVATAPEGFVFDIGNHTYKFTGNFAPINQILGLFKYGRERVPALSDLTKGWDDPSKGEVEFLYKKPEPVQPYISEGEEKTSANYVFIPGGFKPPHKGHISLIKKAHESGGADSMTYVFSGKDSRTEGDVVITAEKAEKVFNKLLDHAEVPVGDEEPGKVTLIYFDEIEVPNLKYADNKRNRKLGRVNQPVKTKSPMVAIGKKAAEDLPGGSTLNVVSSVADKGHGNVLQTIIEKVALDTGKKFTVNSISFETEDVEEGEKISATDMRKALAKREYESFRKFLPDDLEEEEAEEIYKILLGEDLEESGAAAAGGYSAPFFSAEQTSYKREELVTRESQMHLIKELIKEEIKQQKLVVSLRKVIKDVLEEATDDSPTKSTGINKLVTVLKIILPTIESGFKGLTTDIKQRESFKKHLLQAIIDTLSPQDAIRDASGGESAAVDAGSALEEQEIKLDVDIEDPVEADPRGIDPDDPAGEEKQKQKDELTLTGPEGETTELGFPKLPGLDETGRDEAVDAYKKTIDAIVRSYRRLHNAKDREEYKEYLITNLLLYFEKFENDLSAALPDITTPEYERQKAAKAEFEGADTGVESPFEAEAEEAIAESINKAILKILKNNL
jgi:hypothetical protein